MAFDMTILRPILQKKALRKQQLISDAELRRQEIYQKIPRIREIDIELRKTPIDIVRAAFAQKSDAESRLRATRDNNLKLQKERAELLVGAGFAWDYLDVHYDCPHCEDSAYIAPGEPCECLKNEYLLAQRKKLTEKLAIGENTFEEFDAELFSKDCEGSPFSAYDNICRIYDYCVNYARHFDTRSENVLFVGDTGLGKSFLASCIAIEVATSGYSVVYESAFDIFSNIEERHFNKTDGEDKTEKYRTCELLIIDDLGSEMTTAFIVAALQNLITTRATAGKRTIIITSLENDELKSKYNEQIASRLEGDYVKLSFIGQDIRKKKRQQ